MADERCHHHHSLILHPYVVPKHGHCCHHQRTLNHSCHHHCHHHRHHHNRTPPSTAVINTNLPVVITNTHCHHQPPRHNHLSPSLLPLSSSQWSRGTPPPSPSPPGVSLGMSFNLSTSSSENGGDSSIYLTRVSGEFRDLTRGQCSEEQRVAQQQEVPICQLLHSHFSHPGHDQHHPHPHGQNYPVAIIPMNVTTAPQPPERCTVNGRVPSHNCEAYVLVAPF